MNTKKTPNNMFYTHNLNKPVGYEGNCLIEEEKPTSPKKPQTYLRPIVKLTGKEFVEVPKGNPHKRFNDFSIIPRSKYTFDVYLRIMELFSEGISPDRMINYLHNTYPALKDARICVEFVKKVLKLTSSVIVPEMINLVPKDGQWSLMIDGTSRAKDDMVLLIVSAVPLDREVVPNIIPLIVSFIPSENKRDVLNLLHDLKYQLPSLPKSIISDFRPGLLDAIYKIFPDTITQGCHYHMIELVVDVIVNPIIGKINKKINKVKNGLIRWSHHRIYNKKTDNIMIVARTIIKLINSSSGEFGYNFLNFCEKMMELKKWALQRQEFLKSDENYIELLKLLSNPAWTNIKPLLKNLEYSLQELGKLRKNLTVSQYKTTIEDPNHNYKNSSVESLDKLILSWEKIGKTKESFKKAAEKLKNHYDLLIPAIKDPSLHRTTSLLENLNSQIKRFIRKWSGSKRLLRSFDWAAPLAAICRSLRKTDLFLKSIRNVTSYEWIEENVKLSNNTKNYRLQVSISNSIASKDAIGLITHLDNLVIRDIISYNQIC